MVRRRSSVLHTAHRRSKGISESNLDKGRSDRWLTLFWRLKAAAVVTSVGRSESNRASGDRFRVMLMI
ncbi:hypothetical protein HanIR_Chr08g0345091 [Helianthus annuus]|nr:hypothetical protein HanIR_Chr08g0345091 [Helianthus annuus]